MPSSTSQDVALASSLVLAVGPADAAFAARELLKTRAVRTCAGPLPVHLSIQTRKGRTLARTAL